MSHIKEQQILFDKDSDMLFLGSYAYAMDDSRRLFYNYEGSIYADFKKFEPFYGNSVLHFSILHSLTVCDKKFYYHYWRSSIPWNHVTKCTLFCLWLKILVRMKLPLMLHWIIAWSLCVPMSKMVNQEKILSVKFNCTTFDLWKKQVIYSQIWICYYTTFPANVIKHKNGDDVQTAAFYGCHIFYSAKGMLTRG